MSRGVLSGAPAIRRLLAMPWRAVVWLVRGHTGDDAQAFRRLRVEIPVGLFRWIAVVALLIFIANPANFRDALSVVLIGLATLAMMCFSFGRVVDDDGQRRKVVRIGTLFFLAVVMLVLALPLNYIAMHAIGLAPPDGAAVRWFLWTAFVVLIAPLILLGVTFGAEALAHLYGFLWDLVVDWGKAAAPEDGAHAEHLRPSERQEARTP